MEGRPAEEDTPLGGPMLHIWVNSDMAVEAVRQSMHNFVAAPMGQDWFLSLMKVGALGLSVLADVTLPQVSSRAEHLIELKDGQLLLLLGGNSKFSASRSWSVAFLFFEIYWEIYIRDLFINGGTGLAGWRAN